MLQLTCYKFVPTEYMKYKRACEGDFLEIACPATNEVIHIMDAMYGRTLDNSVCPGPDANAQTDCRLNTSIADVQSYCEGQHSCKIAVEVEAFATDPCEGVAKYLDVNYTCVSAAPVITDECKCKLVYCLIVSFAEVMPISSNGLNYFV